MKKNDETKKRLLSEAHEMFKAFKDVGIPELTTLHQIDELRFPLLHDLSPSKIK